MFNQDKKDEKKAQQVPVKATFKVTYLGPYKSLEELEGHVNKFLTSIDDSRRLNSNVLMMNPVTGEYLAVLNYNDLRAFTTEELVEKKNQELAFLAPFQDAAKQENKVEKL